jgi:hypothetical protein
MLICLEGSKKYGFEPTYVIFKEETHCFCDISPYVELAENLKKNSILSSKDLGEIFLADLQKKKEFQNEETESESPFRTFEFQIEDPFERILKGGNS